MRKGIGLVLIVVILILAAGFDGWKIGNRAGYDTGHDAGYEAGQVIGYQQGEKTGYDNGYQQGDEDGYKKGEEAGYKEGYDEGYRSDRLRNPGYEEIKEITEKYCEWSSSKNICGLLAGNMCNELRESGIRTGLVEIYFFDLGSHSLIAFDTPEKGIVYFDWIPKNENTILVLREVKVEVGERYFKENKINVDFDDNVHRTLIIW